jgi:hypothetical protein
MEEDVIYRLLRKSQEASEKRDAREAELRAGRGIKEKFLDSLDWLFGVALTLAALAGVSFGVSALEYFVIGSLLDYIAMISIAIGVLAGICMLAAAIGRRLGG